MAVSNDGKDAVHEGLDIENSTVISNESFSEKRALKSFEMNRSNNSVNFTSNFTDYAEDFIVFPEDLTSIESFSLNENDLMSDGSEIALFQELPTTGFELLIDSETTKSMFLSQLFTSPSLLIDEFTDSEEHFDFGRVLSNLSLEESEVEFNKTLADAIMNITKDWYNTSKADEKTDYSRNLNTSSDSSELIANTEEDFLEGSANSPSSETGTITLGGNKEAELNATLLKKSTFNELKVSNKLPVELESGILTLNVTNSDYEHLNSSTNIYNLSKEIDFVETTSSLDLAIDVQSKETTKEMEAFNLENSSQEISVKEQTGNELFNLKTTKIKSDAVKSNYFKIPDESLKSTILPQISLNENGKIEFNKVPVEEAVSLKNSHMLINSEASENEKFSKLDEFDDDDSNSEIGSELTESEDFLNKSLETFQLNLSESTEMSITPLNITLTNSETLSETKDFLLSSGSYANESTVTGKYLNLGEEYKDFTPNMMPFTLDEIAEVPLDPNLSVEILNVTNSKIFYDIEITDSFNINSTGFDNGIKEIPDVTNFELSKTKNPLPNFNGSGNSKSDVETVSQVFDTKKDLDIFSGLNETKNFNVTDFLTSKPVEDVAVKIQMCPDPGFCFLWFLALDECTDDSQCRGTQKCCESGCSLICVDV